MPTRNEVPQLLAAVAAGDTQAAEHLLPLVYAELKRIAHQMMLREPPGHTLQTTALVHEAWLRLTQGREQPWQSRAHFIGAATEAMRRILVERARRKLRQKHGGEHERLAADEVDIAIDTPDEELLAVHDALDAFAKVQPRQAALVKLRFFGGLEVEEAANVLGISKATAARDWTAARTWLEREITARRNG
jgi:RNA polymerase sigma factor (TIGR02999 family)